MPSRPDEDVMIRPVRSKPADGPGGKGRKKG
jgi:hypothetical protein